MLELYKQQIKQIIDDSTNEDYLSFLYELAKQIFSDDREKGGALS